MQRDDTKLFIMLCGLPGSGKSTLRNSLIEYYRKVFPEKRIEVLSTDDHIELVAQLKNTTYNDIFVDVIDEAYDVMYKNLDNCLKDDVDIIIWDQTNLNPDVRRPKLEKIPNHYFRAAFYIDETDVNMLYERMSKNRGERVIPLNVVEDMKEKYVFPSEDEGFHFVLSQKEAYDAYLG